VSKRQNDPAAILRAIEFMSAWIDDDSVLTEFAAAKAAEGADAISLELTVGLAQLCNALLERVESDSEFSKGDLLQILAGVFLAQTPAVSSPESPTAGG
jgi:hypothetical protein